MCADDRAVRTPELEVALAAVSEHWRMTPDPWAPSGAARHELRHAVMAARKAGACWGDIGAVVGVAAQDLKASFGCMPRHGRRHEDGGCCSSRGGGGHS